VKNYIVHLVSSPSGSFMATKAAQSLDIDVNKKLEHRLSVTADVESPYNIGLIVGNSGSGKTTLAKKMFGADAFAELVDTSQPIIDQFPAEFTYDQRADILNSVGLSQVVCWIRPVSTLSNGQRFRAEAALKIATAGDAVVAIDEWSSVVDRTVAKVMSHALQRAARRHGKRFVLCSCHYDVIEWLQPDWIIDCNAQSYQERRGLQQSREEKLSFELREVDRRTWRNFSRYHYLNENLPGGKIYTFGLFCGDQQIGFQCFAAYIPGDATTFHSNRTVIHPDYVGFGLGMKIINISSKYMRQKYGYRIMAKFSSVPVYKAMIKNSDWKLINYGFDTANVTGTASKSRNNSIRKKVKWFSFVYEPS
jgi:ABC-type dipeptide/oligopeptide/nickel transport system ATPase subunit